jgi:hypothetical protein
MFATSQISWNLILTSQRMIHHWRWIMVSLNLIHQNSQTMIHMQWPLRTHNLHPLPLPNYIVNISIAFQIPIPKLMNPSISDQSPLYMA